jgi:CheY-like chemotaxis protein
MRPVAASREIALECKADPDAPAVPLDEHRVTQVLTNLLNNALKFTPAGGKVTMVVRESRAQPGFVEAAVRDTGRGIAADQRERIFDRLYQVNSGDAATGQGVGLGLYICRELARLHGGDIHVESAEGHGSVFTLRLPKDASARRSRVLVVDDDPALRGLLREVLEKADFNVSDAGDGAGALQAMRRQPPDLVLLDLHMPGRDGAETLRDIRRHWGQVPVIIHTGHTDGALMSRAMEFSPFTLLAKPCPPERLVRTVRALNQHHHGGRARAVAPHAAPVPELEVMP